MSSQDENETQGVVFGVLAGVIFGVIALVAGLGIWKAKQSAAPTVAQVSAAASVPSATEIDIEIVEIEAVGEALAKVYFDLGSSSLNAADQAIVAQVTEALAGKADGIVLLSGFHDASGDAAVNARIAKARAVAVRDALVAGGVALEQIKFRRPESTLGSGDAAEGRRVEVRVQ
ncbi:OmpA family protein [Azonexus sp.]|uniref:OmpA family protein n=1 Tax=Azonexus sp. TaxID=1872668 RepID=UPI0039E3D8D0